MNGESADNLIAYSLENGRVCPQPMRWNELWEMLPNRRQSGSGCEPPLPLILGAWHYASNLEKMGRLAEHIQWAAKHGRLAEASTFLRGLLESDWHHFSD